MAAEKIVATFFTTHATLRAEKMLRQAGIAAELIPAPRSLSADCTIALAFATANLQDVRAILEAEGIEPSGFHWHGLTR